MAGDISNLPGSNEKQQNAAAEIERLLTSGLTSDDMVKLMGATQVNLDTEQGQVESDSDIKKLRDDYLAGEDVTRKDYS